jgi:hypothetical protein
MRSLPPEFKICSAHGWPVTVGPISPGSVSLLFALIKGKPSEPAGARGDSRGGGAIYAAALRQGPSNISRSPTHRTCERSGPASSGGIDDLFLDLGGDSLGAMRIASLVLATWRMDLSPAEVLDAATVAEMAAAARDHLRRARGIRPRRAPRTKPR